MAFAKLKAHLRRIGARSFDTLLKAIGDICDLFSQMSAATSSATPDTPQHKRRTLQPGSRG